MSYVLAFLGFAALVILHELGHFVAAKAVGMRVERFSLFFGPMVVKVKRGETEYGIGTIPLGGYVKISGMNPNEPLPEGEEHRGYYRQPVWKRVLVIAAGPAMNVLIAFLILWGVYAFSAQRPDSHRARIVQVQPNRPASGVLRPGDILLAVDGRPVSLRGESFNFLSEIAAHRCAGPQVPGCVAATPVRFTVLRGGRVIQVAVRPRYDAKAGRPLVGITSGFVLHRESLVGAMGASIRQMWNVTSTT